MRNDGAKQLHKCYHSKVSLFVLVTILLLTMLFTGCSGKEEPAGQTDQTTEAPTSQPTQAPANTPVPTAEPTAAPEPSELLIGAAASLQASLEELQGSFETQYPNVKLTFTFAGSGTLEQQIREGAPMDIFISAAEKQMDALETDSFLLDGTRVNLLENQVALIVPRDSTLSIAAFEDITKANVIAIGDPASVPAGQYAQEIYTNLGSWEDVLAKATLGKDVTEVLTWVSSGNADAGVVYTTDAALSDDVIVAAIAPEGSHKKVIYPAAVIKESKQTEAAGEFISFLQSQEAKDVFVSYGFKIAE